MEPLPWNLLWQIVRTIGNSEAAAQINPLPEEIVRQALLEMSPALQQRKRFSVAQELAWLWRIPLFPLAMSPRFKKEWNLFLPLEVGFFFPLRKGKRPPGHLGEIGVLLADREYLSLVVADGDPRGAQSFLAPQHDEFWRAIIPQGCVVPYSTVKDRIVRGLQLMAFFIDRRRSIEQGSFPPGGEAGRVPPASAIIVK